MKEFSRFLQNYQSLLSSISSRNSVINTDKRCDGQTIPDLISTDKDTLHLQQGSSIGIDFSYAMENISTMDLMQSDNKCLNKTIAVFIQLCMEVRELNKEGDPLLSKCLFANEELCELSQNSEKNTSMNTEVPVVVTQNERFKIDKISLSAEVIAKINTYLRLFFKTNQFIERCFTVILEIITQFTALFDNNNSSYINVDYSSLHFQVSLLDHMYFRLFVKYCMLYINCSLQTVFNYLAEAMVLIIKFDSIFNASPLRNIWSQYINTIKSAEYNINNLRASSQNWTFSTKDVSGFTNVLLKVDFLLSGCLFQVSELSHWSEYTQNPNDNIFSMI